MTPDKPTPRTDQSSWRETATKLGEVVSADFARQLERELSTTTEAAKQAVMERDDARNALRDALMHGISAPNTPDPTTP